MNVRDQRHRMTSRNLLFNFLLPLDEEIVKLVSFVSKHNPLLFIELLNALKSNNIFEF